MWRESDFQAQSLFMKQNMKDAISEDTADFQLGALGKAP